MFMKAYRPQTVALTCNMGTARWRAAAPFTNGLDDKSVQGCVRSLSLSYAKGGITPWHFSSVDRIGFTPPLEETVPGGTA